MSRDIIIVGSGVIGLTCALVLAENGKSVKVISNHFPGDPLSSNYTSPWAGAHFRPFPSRSLSDEREMQLTRETQTYFKRLESEEPESSIRFLDGLEYFEAPDNFYLNLSPGYSDKMSNFKKLPKKNLPHGVAMGTSYSTWVLNAPLYLQYLERKLSMKYGVEFVRCELMSLKQVFQTYPNSIVVNATGKGLQYSGGYDPKVFLIRGQTLLLRVPDDCPYLKETVTHQSKDGAWTFVIPRPFFGGVILGGTKQPDDLCPYERLEDTEAIKSRARKLFPELQINGKFDVKKVNVGFRPARENGCRIEVEKIENNTIIHAYGAGGMGFELSYGVASKVNELLMQLFNTSKL
ncbi:uncharacterized protein PRCAT00005005001 [Priceomyces carsonii]|uniref:uncharacterized protein n=1 Tax=Priceomyces carsonii TaxID=28549 RepID=UPI002EDB3F90|nr:unnamed protein product [Priceomyces carsonii]